MPVSGLTGVVAVAGAHSNSLALKRDGTVWAWGDNEHGQLGDGTTADRSTPVQVSVLTGVVAVAGGGSHSLAVKADGTAWAWGGNGSGQLGDGTTTDRSTPTPVRELLAVAAVAGGSAHSLALRSDGTVWAWGSNWYGQLGDGGSGDQTTAVQVRGITGVSAISAGPGHNLALKGDGTVWAWGYNLDGQLGPIAIARQATPARVTALSGVVRVAKGGSHSLALMVDGTIWAWGHNSAGQLGNGITTETILSIPAKVNALSGVVAVAAGSRHSLGLKPDGTVWTWQYGSTAPEQVSGLSGIVALAAGSWHSLAVKADGTAWAWGENEYGQLGDGTASNRETPVQVNGLGRVVAVAGGETHSLALIEGGTVWTWGAERWAPVEVSGLTDIVAISAGYWHSLAVKADGTVWTWERDSTTPVQVGRLSGVVAVAAGSSHNLVVKGDGTVWAWGGNENGQLGDGTTATRPTPMKVNGLVGFVAAATGYSHSLAVRGDGTVWAWGDNDAGELGDGTTTNRFAPLPVSGLTGVVAVDGHRSHNLALKRDGTVWTWGNRIGGLDVGSPVPVIPLGSPDLAITSTHAGPITVGEQGLYTLTIANLGAVATASPVTVTDTLPVGLNYISADGTGWSCSAADRTVTCTNPGPFNPGALSTITLTVNAAAPAWPGVTNFAAVSSASDPNVWNNTAGDPTLVLLGPVGVGAVVNAASFLGGPLAPGEIVTVFGAGIGWPDGISGSPNTRNVFENALGETRVLFDGVAGPVIFSRADQVTAIGPYALAGKRTTEVQIEYRGVKSSPQTLAVADSAPGIFTVSSTGSGQGAVLNENATFNSSSAPARRGSIIVLFATGEGQLSPPGVDGMIAAPPLPQPLLRVSVLIAGQEAEVRYAGCARGLVSGVQQVNARIPETVAPGPAVPVTLVVGEARSQPGVTVAIE